MEIKHVSIVVDVLNMEVIVQLSVAGGEVYAIVDSTTKMTL